jgi:hypothetical protein
MTTLKTGIRVVMMAAVLGSGLMLAACDDGRPGYNSGRHHDRHGRHDRDHDGDHRDDHGY